MLSAKFVKNCAGWIICFIFSFMISRYGMPLYSVTAWIVEHCYQLFSPWQADTYEAGTDPVTFISLIGTITLYATILYVVLKVLVRKIR